LRCWPTASDCGEEEERVGRSQDKEEGGRREEDEGGRRRRKAEGAWSETSVL